MSYVRIMTALTRLQQARRTKAEVSSRISRQLREAKDNCTAAQKQIDSMEQKVRYNQNLVEQPLLFNYYNAKDAKTQAELMMEINQTKQGFAMYIQQYKQLMEDKLHELQKIYDRLETSGALEKEAANQEEQLAEAEHKEAIDEQKKQGQIIYPNS